MSRGSLFRSVPYLLFVLDILVNKYFIEVDFMIDLNVISDCLSKDFLNLIVIKQDRYLILITTNNRLIISQKTLYLNLYII